MKNLFWSLLFLFPAISMATEKTVGEGPLPYNYHEFDWEATSTDGKTFKGHGVDNTARGALVYIRHEIDKLAREGKVADGTEFDISFEWKGCQLIRGATARIKRPVEMTRGPDKEREIPRGPNPLDGLKRLELTQYRELRDRK